MKKKVIKKIVTRYREHSMNIEYEISFLEMISDECHREVIIFDVLSKCKYDMILETS
jgi:hypothetical protein